tara:strand:- start:311 stop:679 length:369 start_codon:yes stop_codon:yes gene_type:complete
MIDIENYDKNNIFAKILRKEVPADVVYEDDFIYAFKDISAKAPVHILVVPKEPFCSFNDFSEKADDETILNLVRTIGKITKKLNLKDGYRIIANIGKHGGQEVPHLHFHILGGKSIGPLVSK